MSKSYDRNIERLKANQRQISAQEQNITTQAAKERGEAGIRAAAQLDKLTPFSTALQEWKDKDIKEKIEEGKAQLEKDQAANAKWLEENGTDLQKRIRKIEEAEKAGALLEDFKEAKAQEKVLQALKGEWLRRTGTSGYPDAERIAKLSPWQQVGYAQQDLRSKKDIFADQLAHSMKNGTENITLGGLTYNAEQISGNKLAFQMKEQAVHFYADKVYKNLGLHKYSKEMLEMAGIPEAIRTAKEAQISKHRTEYNIESSQNTQKKAELNWNTSEKTGFDIELFLLTWGNTTDTKGNLYHWRGALDQFFKMQVSEGIKNGGVNEELQRIAALPIPESMRERLGVKAGTTFGKHWKNRFKAADQAITDGYTKYIDNLRKNQKNKENTLAARFDADVESKYKGEDGQPGRTLTQAEYQWWEQQFTDIGAEIPSQVKNYKTASERDRLKNVKDIENHIKLNRHITHQQLDSYHPLAAGQFRDKADAYEKSTFVDTGADKIIKGALDNTFADMGVKDREKSTAYQIAYQNAKEDFHNQYTEYTGMGLSESTALHLALHGVSGAGEIPAEVKSYIQGRQGVKEEIIANGENSKYTRAGLHLENTIGSEFKRMGMALTAKKEMREANLEGKLLRKTKVLGGDYGQTQLNEIKKNIKQYGLYRGIAMSEESVQFYKAIMVGRHQDEGGWWGLIHDQLKADDPSSEGLQRNGVGNSILPLLTKKVDTADGEEEDLDDEDGVLEVSSSAINAADNGAPLLAYNTITDANNYHNNLSNGSVFDQPDQIPAYLGGIA